MSKGYKGKFVVESTFSHKEEDVTLILHSESCFTRKREESCLRRELETYDPFVKNGEETAVLAWESY